MTQLLPPKKEVALALLERSNVDVYLDPRAKGVVVPPQFRKEPRLILKIGLNMPVPIPDLRVDEESMSCTLSFNRSPFYCVVPWSAVFAMVGEDGRGMVWPDDVPQELAVKVVDPGDSPQGPRAVDAPAGPRRLEAAPSPSSSSASASSPSPSASASASGASGARREGARRSSKLAEDTSSPTERTSKGAGGKRKKKKEEERPRPVLVSVPTPPADSPERAPARDRAEDSRSEAAAEGPRQIRQAPDQRRPPPSAPPRDGVSAVPPARPRSPVTPSQRRPPPSDGAARPKRELPPYLRVVK
jgi:stringent starvation protein B